ncbi:hypothetical protein R1sor_012242 [Riccia sorocarpa]|uniref:Artemis n=1 Tax=Riccia sorocarpa TaxID=122646 RepID=A0ABD3I416_9MARC
MPVELKGKYPFCVDTWSLLSRKKNHHFLSHAHTDHTSGIESFANRRIYCSDITRLLLLRRFPKLESAEFVILEIGETKLILDDEESFTVTSFDANHCAGALMFLFEGNFGNVLHTGDCRLTDDCLKNILGKYKAQQCVLDCVYLDCTLGRERLRIPSKQEAFQHVQQCILNHPKAPVVYLAIDMLGNEELLGDIARYFRSKIYIDRKLLPEYYADLKLLIPEVLTQDPDSTRFHICEGFPKLYERAKVKFMEAHRQKQEDPLFIRPSAQWYTYGERLEGAGCGFLLGVTLKRPTDHLRRTLPAPKAAEKDQYGVWHVCYSAHSSRSELERAMEVLWPKEVISTTPHCHAKEVMGGRAGLYHIDIELPKTGSSNLTKCPNGSSKDVESVKTLVEITNRSSPAGPSPRKKLNISKERIRAGESLEKVIPLFGSARYTIPTSPPLSFSSTDSQDSEATELYFSDHGDDGGDSAHKSASNEKYPSSAQEGTEEVEKKATCFESEATMKCEDASTLVYSSDESLGFQTQVCSETFIERDTEVLGVGRSQDGSVMDIRAELQTEASSRTKRNANGVALEESTRKLYRSFHVPIPLPLPSLLDLYNFNV